MAKADTKNGSAADAAKALTEYIVLEALEGRASRIVWAPVLNAVAEEGPDGQPRVFLAASKTSAIRRHTGDGADVIEGTWKAIPFSSWKGGEQTKRVTASERLPFEEPA